jgi:hypothetical protein
MTIELRPCAKALLICALAGVITGCGPSKSLKEEAYDAGWDSAWNERCNDLEPPLMMPSKYDDSTESGELVRYYRAGIADAKADSGLCD